MLDINLELIKKYDRPGPRYTSYPTAPHFAETFTHEDYLKEIHLTNLNNSTPISVYFHLPYCDTLCYFCGCNMIITRNRSRVQEYIDYIKKEVLLFKDLINPDRKISQLHWGGGTPTHLSPTEIADLAGFIAKNFEFTPGSENSCEIDPRGLTKEHLEALKISGFNRISMGVQDFDDKVQVAVNRVQPESMTVQVISWIRELKFNSINLDLMYGLPHQTKASFERTLDKVIEISPDRIAVFNYAHLPWMKKHMGLINEADIPSPEIKLDILKMTIEKLVGAGYVFIGMDHFAKPDDELSIAFNEKKLYRNFQGYSTNSGLDMYSFGITSISQLENIYAQNFKNEKEYFEALNQGKLPVAKGYSLTADDHLRRYVIMKLMCDFELDIDSIEKKFNINFKSYFNWGLENLKMFADDGLVTVTDNKISVVNLGQLLIRNIALNFDGYIENNQDKAKYSKTL